MSQKEMRFDCDFLAKKFGKEFLALIDETNKTNKEIIVPFCKEWTDIEGGSIRIGKKDVGTSMKVDPEKQCRDGEEYIGNFHTHPPSSSYGAAIPSLDDLRYFYNVAIKHGLRGPFCVGGGEGEMSCGMFTKLDPKHFHDYWKVQENFFKCAKSKSPEQIKSQCVKPFKENAEKILKKYPYCTTNLLGTKEK